MENDYLKTTFSEKKLKEVIDENDPQTQEDLVQKRFSYLRATYEAFVIYNMLNGIVVRFDRQIKHSNIEDIYCPP